VESSCIYPKHTEQPIREESLLSGPLEETNRAYAIAKIAGLELCRTYREQYKSNFTALMPTNLYGPGDRYDLQNSHVIPALIRKFHCAKKDDNPRVIVWGSGTPLREFLHVDDLATAILRVLEVDHEEGHINVGTGKDISITDLAELIKDVVGYTGQIIYDRTKPDGTPAKRLDISIMSSIGWEPRYTLVEGLREVYSGLKNENWY